MWTRVELKERAKAALHRNYWKIVLVSALLFLLGCGVGGHSAFNATGHTGHQAEKADTGEGAYTEEETDVGQETDEMRSLISVKMNSDTGETTIQGIGGTESAAQNYEISFMEVVAAGIMAIVVFVFVLSIALAVVLVLDIFLLNPLSVGGCRFMVKSVTDVAQVKEITYGFDHSYKNVVKVLFFKDLFIFLWTLLFVVPGIVKMFQYYMVPYILTENPDMEYREALQTSRDMMEGNKWNTFVLGLSFILWDFFGVITLGVGEILYVQPYRQLTFAALYCKLKEGRQGYGQEDGYGL